MKTTLCCSILVALAALSGTAQARSNYIPRTERGQLVANLVERWSPEAAQRMKTTPGAWANAMGSAFAKAPMEQLRRAVAASRFEDMIDTLDFSTSSTSSRSTVFHTMRPCRIVDTRRTPEGKIASGETRTFSAWAGTDRQGGEQDCYQGLPVALALKVTAIDPEGSGTLSVISMGEPVTESSAINYDNQVLSNHRVDVRVDPQWMFNVFTTNSTHLVIDVVGRFEPVPGKLDCRRTAEFSDYVIDGTSSKIVAAPVCESHETQTATFCRSGSKSTVLLGTKDKECVFADATPNSVGGSAYAASKCCSVDTN